MEGIWSHWVTLRECDQRVGAPKGTAFRAFKGALTSLTEGDDFRRLDASLHAAEIRQLKDGNRLYDSTVHALLLSPEIAERMGFKAR